MSSDKPVDVTENVWDELWDEIDWNRVTTIPFITERIQKIKAEGDRLTAGITQLNECLGEYESQEWCGYCIVDGKCAQITMAVNELTETRKRLAGELLIADGKLEAVKTHLDTIVIPSVSDITYLNTLLVAEAEE